jgi:hypothetical protein
LFHFLRFSREHTAATPLERPIGQSFTPLHLAAGLLTGLFFGVALALGKPLIVFAAILGLLLFLGVLRRPEIGLLLIVLVDASVVYESAIPVLPLGIGSFHGTDVILLGLLFLIPFNRAVNPAFKIIRTPMNQAVLIFFLAVLLAALYGLFITKVDYKIVMRMLRIFSYYLMFFIVTHFIHTKEKIKFLINGLLAISVVVSLAMLLQAALGSNVQIMPGRIETAKTFETKYEATRILPPGQTLIQVMLVTTFCLMITLKKHFLKSAYFYLLLLFGVANLLTYNRSTWVIQILSLGLFAFLVPGKAQKKIAAWVAVMLLLGGLSYAAIMGLGGKPAKTVAAMTDRFASLFTGEKIKESATLKWRRLENYAALKRLREDWVFGIGLGNAFAWKKKPISYMHNFYLWITLNMGIIGFLAFAWFFLLFLFRGFTHWRKIEDNYLRAVYLSFTIGGLGLIPGAIVNPQFREWYSIIVITIMIGLNESIRYNNSIRETVKIHG